VYVDGYSLYRGYFVPNATDPSGTEIWSEAPLDTYLESMAGKVIKTIPKDDPCKFGYKQTAPADAYDATVSGDSIESEIIKAMLAKKAIFKIVGADEKSALESIKKHVETRLSIIRNARALKASFKEGAEVAQTHHTDPTNPEWSVDPAAWFNSINNSETLIECQLALNLAFVGAGTGKVAALPNRTRTVWIPGDWGYVHNTAYIRNKWGSGLKGGNVLYMGKDSFWGFTPGGGKELALRGWTEMIKKWEDKDKTTYGAPRVMDWAKYPTIGLRVGN